MTRSVAVPLVVALAVVLGLSIGPSRAAESLLNCNQVELEDRCDCNLRVLRAIAGLRVTVSDPVDSPNPTPARTQDALLHERLRRWRTFIAPACAVRSTGHVLPEFNQHVPPRDGVAAGRQLQPMSTVPLTLGQTDVVPAVLLPGRWEGWQTLPDGKPTRVFFHISEIDQTFVKACSSHGMVFGVLRGGFLEFPGPQSSGIAYTFRLWRSGPPTFRDLEGVALLELRPNEELVAGLVWLTRAQRLFSSFMPTGYHCEDLELEDQRTGTKPPELELKRP